jgi:streptogramin lyase
VAIGSDGSLYTTHNGPYEIIKVSPGEDANVLWSSPTPQTPWGIAVDATGNVFASIVSSYIVKISAEGAISTWAGNNETGSADGQGADARFNFPFGVALDKDENLYVADGLNFKIRKITSGGTVSTLAGSSRGHIDGLGANAKFEVPMDVAPDSQGNVYVSDGHRIRKVTPDGQVSTIAGGESGYRDGTTSTAQFSSINGLVIDPVGNLYVCDQGNFVVRRIEPNGTVVTVAGSTPGTLDGQGWNAKFVVLLGITLDTDGAIYLAQSGGPIRKIVIN